VGYSYGTLAETVLFTSNRLDSPPFTAKRFRSISHTQTLAAPGAAMPQRQCERRGLHETGPVQVREIPGRGMGGRGLSPRPVRGVNNIPFDPYDFFGYLAAGLLLKVGMDILFGFPHVVGADLKLIDGGIVVLMAYVGGQLVASPARLLPETFIMSRR